MDLDFLNLVAKERCLLEYLEKCEEEGFQPKIGDICTECHTTPRTLLGKTYPEILAKLKDNYFM